MREGSISIVIPVLNEAKLLGRLLQHLEANRGAATREIIVVDGGSRDESCAIARRFSGVKLLQFPASPERCRATQMNFGAQHAKGEILWFVHGDTLPPGDYEKRLGGALTGGWSIGGFAFDFESSRFLLRVNSWFTRLNLGFTRGGDQTLFVTRTLFDALSGYRPDYVIMEEYDLIDRAKQLGFGYRRMPGSVKVSARKHEQNSWFEVQRANLTAYRLYRRGVAPSEIREKYYKLIRHPKDDE